MLRNARRETNRPPAPSAAPAVSAAAADPHRSGPTTNVRDRILLGPANSPRPVIARMLWRAADGWCRPSETQREGHAALCRAGSREIPGRRRLCRRVGGGRHRRAGLGIEGRLLEQHPAPYSGGPATPGGVGRLLLSLGGQTCCWTSPPTTSTPIPSCGCATSSSVTGWRHRVGHVSDCLGWRSQGDAPRAAGRTGWPRLVGAHPEGAGAGGRRRRRTAANASKRAAVLQSRAEMRAKAARPVPPRACCGGPRRWGRRPGAYGRQVTPAPKTGAIAAGVPLAGRCRSRTAPWRSSWTSTSPSTAAPVLWCSMGRQDDPVGVGKCRATRHR